VVTETDINEVTPMSERTKSAFELGKPLILSTDFSAAEEMEAVEKWVTPPSVDSEISNLEWRVVEAAVACKSAAATRNEPLSKYGFSVDLERAVCALIAARDKAEKPKSR
jgi:hypothetical protein